MKRRKWWFVAFSVTFLGACILCWKWAERPPFRFIDGCKLVAVDVWDSSAPGGHVTFTYACTTPFREQASKAKLEVTDGSWSDSTHAIGAAPNVYTYVELSGTAPLTSISWGGSDWDYLNVNDLIGEKDYGPIEGWTLPDYLVGARSVVYYTRPATPLDRFRAWLLTLQGKGPQQ